MSTHARNHSIPSGELPEFRFENTRRRSTIFKTGIFKRTGAGRIIEDLGSQRGGPGINVQYENTYKCDPDVGTKFSQNRVQEVVKDILSNELNDYEYDSATVGSKVTDITKSVMEEVKALGFLRYKIVVYAVLTEKGENQPGLNEASRCIWNVAHDTWMALTYDSPRVSAVVTIYGVYFE